MALDHSKRIIQGHFFDVHSLDHLSAHALNWTGIVLPGLVDHQIDDKAERFIPSALCEWVYGLVCQNLQGRLRMLKEWNHHDNWRPPHQGVAGKAPMSRRRSCANNFLQFHIFFENRLRSHSEDWPVPPRRRRELKLADSLLEFQARAATSSAVTAPAIHLAHLAPGGSVVGSAGRFHWPGRMPATPVRRACGVILPTYRGHPGQ